MERLDRSLELVEARRTELADDAARIDDDVRRHAAHAELARERLVGVEEDRPLDAPHLAEALDLGSRLRPLPDIDEHHLDARPGGLGDPQFLEERRFRVARSSPAGEE